MDVLQLQKCTNCKVSRDTCLFIGKCGDSVRTCQRCRDKDDRQKERPDVIAKKNQRQREKQYYKGHRERKRNENEQEFLKHNAEMGRQWRSNNREHCRLWARQNFKHRFHGIKSGAQKRGIMWNEDLTDEIGYQLLNSRCYYCGLSPNGFFNGIDRINNKEGYSLSNTVPCCTMCNVVKGCLDPNTFLQRCMHISFRFGGNGKLCPKAWSDADIASLWQYQERAERKKLEFKLTEEEFDELTAKSCFYCSKETTLTHMNGIDRMDNTKGYTLDNCATCCRECNQMKLTKSAHDFIWKCKRVSSHCMMNKITFSEIEVCLQRIAKREKHDIPKEKISISEQQPKKPTPEIVIPDCTSKQRVYTRGSNLPADCGINQDDIPKHCYYVRSSDGKGDGFCCGRNHPKQLRSGKDWKTTRSKAVSLNEKFQQLHEYINAPEQLVTE